MTTKRKASARPQPQPLWEAFAVPPRGSLLAEVVDHFETVTQSRLGTDHPAVLRPLVIEALRKQGMPEGRPPAWASEMIDERTAAGSARLKAVAAAAAASGNPSAYAALAGLAALFRAQSDNPNATLQQTYVAVAELLGPSVGSGEAGRLCQWAMAHLSGLNSEQRDLWLVAIAEVDRVLGPDRTALYVTEHEFSAVCGIIDEIRFGPV